MKPFFNRNFSSEDRPASILFVCSGNICRSPTAEAVFRAVAGDKIAVDSAGTHGLHAGDPPDPRAVATALRRGVQMQDLRARQVEAVDFSRFDLILGMDRGHVRQLEALRPLRQEEGAGVVLFLEYADIDGVKDVPDPWYGGMEDFEKTYALIAAGIAGLARKLGVTER